MHPPFPSTALSSFVLPIAQVRSAGDASLGWEAPSRVQFFGRLRASSRHADSRAGGRTGSTRQVRAESKESRCEIQRIANVTRETRGDRGSTRRVIVEADEREDT